VVWSRSDDIPALDSILRQSQGMTGSATAHHPANAAAAMAANALADAVRRNLAVPASVSPAEQFHLMLTDRVANDQPTPGIH